MFSLEKYLKMTNSRIEKRKQRKNKKRQTEVRKKILRKRSALREEAKVEKEIEKIKNLSRDRIRPYRKPKDETKHSMSD